MPVQVRQGEQGQLAEVIVPTLRHVAHQGEEAVPPVAERHRRDQAETARLEQFEDGRGGGGKGFVLHRLQVDNLSESLYKGGDLVLSGDRFGKHADSELAHK